MHATISHIVSSLSRTNHQSPLFNSSLITPLLFPQFYSLHLHALMQQTTAIKPPHPLLSPSRKHQRRSIPSPPLHPSDGRPSSSPFAHGCSSKSLSFFSNKMESHDQSEYVMLLILSSRHDSNNW